MTEENLKRLAELVIANRNRIRSCYKRKDDLEGAMARELLAGRKEPLEVYGYRFRMVKAKPPSCCEICADKWRALFPSTALELSVDKIPEKAKVAA